MATIRDVAQRAGVGIGTVSRVLNDSPHLSRETDARVREAIEELDYERSPTARSLSLGRSHAVGVVAPFFTSPSVVERLRGVVEHLAHHGYALVVSPVETPKQRAAAFRGFSGRRVDGVIVISLPLSDEELETLEDDDLPVVLVDVLQGELRHVGIDDQRGGELATKHLLAKGHRRIGFVGDVPTNPFGFTSSERRRRGYQRALRAAGIEPDPALERLGFYGREQARSLARDLLGGDEPPSAVFAASDTQAVGVLEAAAALRLSVPTDLAVIGFDDVELADVLGLTTVRQPLLETGAQAAALLLAAIEGDQDVETGELAPLEVIERQTT